MEYIIIIALVLAVLLIGAKYSAVNKQIKSMKKQMTDYENPSVTVDFVSENLEELVVCINKIIKDKKNAQIEADRNYRILKQSIANISHDMRTPLTSVIGYLQLAIKDSRGGEQPQNLETALERAKYCGRLIDDFYELSVAEAKDAAAELESVDLSDLLCEQILGNYIEFEKSGIKPIYLQSDRQSLVMADRGLLTRVLQNLISNAIKYTIGNVTFFVDEMDGNITKLAVSNPVAQTHIDTEMLFEKFYQNDLSRSNEGSGIGLYLCRCFLEKMNGSITAEIENNVLSINVFLTTSD